MRFKFLVIAFLAFSLTALPGCMPEDYFNRKPTVSVAQMQNPAPPDAPPLYCQIGRGSALFGHDWFDFGDVSFSLRRGERVNVSVPRLRGGNDPMTLQAWFDGNGQKLIFCPFIETEGAPRISCASLYALETDLREGIKRTFDVPAAIRGGVISCAYNPQNMKSLAIPAAGGN